MAGREQDPETIERDIEDTQDEIGDTVDKIEEKLNPSEISRSLLGDTGHEWMREGFRVVRENPVPAAMIAVGTVWLFATSDSPLIRRMTDRLSQRFGGETEHLRSRDEEPAPIGPPPERGARFDRRVERA